jgi:bacteriocin-like protein
MEEVLMEEVLRELTETELASVAGGFLNINNFDSNQGNQAILANFNFDSNQGNQGITFL